MGKVAVVTSFSTRGYDVYGKRFIDSFMKYWPQDVALWVYHEGMEPDRRGPIYRDLMADRDFLRFLASCPVDNTDDYRFQTNRFSRKVFAITDPNGPTTGWRIWIDADVETIAPVTSEFFDAVCPHELGVAASYLGRTDWHHSEMGFCAYNTMIYGTSMLRNFRRLYTTGQIHMLRETHDSYAWDFVRAGMTVSNAGLSGPLFNNLAAGAPGKHPWPDTILGNFLVHHKGPGRKLEAYGATV